MHIKPRKRLGQNFLTDANVRRRIISSCQLTGEDSVLEIGSGKGELTRLIAQYAKRVIGLEIDQRLSQALTENLTQCENVKILRKDILKLNLKKEVLIPGQITGKIKVIGNIPYYISTPIIEFIIDNKDSISSAFLTVQKEFAKRITAVCGSKDYGSFSCFVQYYTLPKVLFNISKNSFFPVPKVDSSFLTLAIRERPAVEVINEKLFFKIIRSAFGQRRKTLKNSLSGVISQETLGSFFLKKTIDPRTRPECLTLQDFASLANT